MIFSAVLRFPEEPRACGLDGVLQPAEERVFVEAGRDRIQDFGDNRAGQAAATIGAARTDAGIERQRHAGHAGLVVKMDDAGLVARLGAGRPPRAFGKNNELARASAVSACRARAVMRASAAMPALRSIGISPALRMYQPNSGSHINSRLRT